MTSINISIHNKGQMISEVLERIKQHTTGAYELIMVLDGCTDSSEWRVEKFAAMNPTIATKILHADNVFETKANNIAAKASSGDHLIIVQDDVLINEPEWNERLLSPFRLFVDVFSVTGRTAHNWMVHGESESMFRDPIRDDRWCDILIATDHAGREHGTARDVFAVRETANRSPLAINRADFEAMGGFDEAFAPLDSDEHDLHYRMQKKLGKVCGGVWIDYESRPEWGGTRDRNGVPHSWMYAAQQKNSRQLYRRHKDYITTHSIKENRKLK